MLCCLCAQQGADQCIQALELRVVTQLLCNFARVIAKLIQTTLAADHQHAIERSLDDFLGQHVRGPTSSTG